MKRVISAALGVALVAWWGLFGKWKLGVPGEWQLQPNASVWPVGAWGLPLAVLFIFGGAAALSVYDRFKRAKTLKEQKSSTVTALVCLGLLGALWPWSLLGPGAPFRSNVPTELARVTLEGRLNLIAVQWSDIATEYFGTAYEISDAREFARTYAQRRQNPSSRVLAHVATHPPGATLLFYGARRLAESVPGLGDGLNALAGKVTGQDPGEIVPVLQTLRVNASRGAGAPEPPPLPPGALGVALLCAALAGLSLVAALPAVYGLASSGDNEGGGAEARGLLAAALWVLAPTLGIYAFSLDAVIASGAAWTLFFALRALQTRKKRWALATGLGLACCSMLSFGALALVGVLLGAAFFSRIEWKTLARTIALASGAFLGAWVLAAIWGGFNPLEVMFNATKAHRFATLSIRSHFPWFRMNALTWAIFCGWPLVVALIGAALRRKELIIRTGARKEVETPDLGWAFALGTILTLVVLGLSGQVRGEVERLWLFLLAPLAASAWPGRLKEAAILVALQAIQTLVMAATLAPLIRPF